MAELAKESEPDVIPAGWYHSGQVAESTGLTKGKADHILRRKAERGELQCRLLRAPYRGYVREMLFYGPPDSKP